MTTASFGSLQQQEEEECRDVAMDCWDRALEQGCITDFVNMQVDCRRTCLLCGNRIGDKVYALYNEEPQDIPVAGNFVTETWDIIEATDQYMYETVYDDDDDDDLLDIATECKNRHASCSFWSAIGECQSNTRYMEINCAPACQTCGKFVLERRCPVSDELLATSVWRRGTGDLHRMFERIVMDPEWQQAYSLQILSQPQPTAANVLDGPWIIILDQFLTDEECDTLIQLGGTLGYERSEDLSEEMNFDGTFDGVVSDERTSTNAWCEGPCLEHPHTQAVHERIERLLDIPRTHYEELQLLRYEVGQKYGIHHDFIESQIDRQPGPRVSVVT